MFGKSKVSQAMIDAVNSVLEVKVEQKSTAQPSDSQRVPMAPADTSVKNLSEASEKVATPTGMKVYGSSYGNSKKARQDQTKSSVDTLKGPKDKEVKEDMSFAKKLLEVVRKSDVPAYLRKAKGDTPLTVADVKAPKKDSISAPENLAKARNEEVEIEEGFVDDIKQSFVNGMADKVKKAIPTQYHKHYDFDSIKSVNDTKEIVKKAKSAGHMNEEVELDELSKSTLGSYVKKANAQQTVSGQGMQAHHGTYGDGDKKQFAKHQDVMSKRAIGLGKAVYRPADKLTKEEVDLTEEQLDEMINEVLSKDASAGDWISDFVKSDNPKFAGKSKAERKKMALGAYYGAQKESYEPADTAITTDTLTGRMPGGKSNSFKSYKLRVRPLEKEGEQKPGDDTPKTIQPQDTPARKSHEVHEATIAGTPGWEKVEKNVKDKSGAVHTPMSRAKDLARAAFKNIQSKTKVK